MAYSIRRYEYASAIVVIGHSIQYIYSYVSH